MNGTNNGFGILVRHYRKKSKMNQVTLGVRAGVDNSIISRIENGTFIPSIDIVEILASIFKLNEENKNEIYSAFGQAVLNKEGLIFEQIFLKDAEAIQLANDFVEDTRLLREQGMPKRAVAESAQRIQLIYELCKRANKELTRKILYQSLSRLLMEVSKSYMDYLLPDEVWEFMNPLIEHQRRIAVEIKDSSSLLMVELSKEAALYVHGNFYEAHKVGAELYSNIRILDSSWHSEVLRAMAINAGNLKEEDEVINLSNDIQYFILDSGYEDPLNISFILEGLARAQGSVRNKNVESTIEKAWHFIDLGKKQGNYSPFRTVQLIRTQLRIMSDLESTDYTTVERLGQKGLILCEEMGYKRYESEILNLLKSMLNSNLR